LLWDQQTQDLLFAVKTDPLGERRDPERQALTYELRLRQLGRTSAYRVEFEQLGNRYRVETGQMPEPKKFLERRPGRAVIWDFDDHGINAHPDSIPDDQTLLSLLAGPFSNQLVVAFRDSLVDWTIYHDLRVDQDALLRQAAVARVEQRVAPDGQNLIPVLHTLYTGDREFKHTVDAAMRAAFGVDFEELVFPPAADQRVQLRVRWRSLKTEQSAANLSDGTLRFLMLIAIFASPDPGGLIALDEPETGLHPGTMAIVAELAAAAAERTQVLLTTHSPQFLDAFHDVKPTVAVVGWEDGETRLTLLDQQELDRWLEHYSLGSLQLSGELEGLA